MWKILLLDMQVSRDSVFGSSANESPQVVASVFEARPLSSHQWLCLSVRLLAPCSSLLLPKLLFFSYPRSIVRSVLLAACSTLL